MHAGKIFGAKGVRHVKTAFGYLWHHLQSGLLSLFHVRGTENPADLFTKNLSGEKVSYYRSMIGMHI